MRTVTINVYHYSELDEKSREAAIDNVRVYMYFPWMAEYEASLKAFCDALGINVPRWESDAWNHFYYFPNEDDWDAAMEGRTVDEFDENSEPTGYFSDNTLFRVFVNVWKKHDSPTLAIRWALDKFFQELQDDYRHFYSDEGVLEYLEANEIEFTENGTIWSDQEKSHE